jgi:predicted MFS family arabinose efflux permease
VGGILAGISYHLLFWVEGGVYILVSFLILVLLPARSVSTVKPATAANPIAPSPWKDKFVIRFMLLVTVYTTCFILLFRLVGVYWKEVLHIDESLIGLLLGLNGILVALFEMVLVRHWESRNRYMNYIVAGILSTALGYVFLVVPYGPPLAMAAGTVLFITFGEMLSMPFMNSLIMRRAGENNRGKYAAAYAMAWSIAQITGPGGGALIVERSGYPVLWGISIGLCLLCAFGFSRLAKTKWGVVKNMPVMAVEPADQS